MDDLLECSIEVRDCIKVAITAGAGQGFGCAPADRFDPVEDFDTKSLEDSNARMGYNKYIELLRARRTPLR